MRLSKFFLTAVVLVGLLSFFMSGVNRVPVERVAISSGIGYDIEMDLEGNVIHSVPTTYYISSDGEKNSKTIITKGKTLAETREDRQRKIEKKLLLGFQKVYLISEDHARYGIKDIIDILFNSSQVSDTALVAVCKGKSEDILKMKIEGYPSSSDFIEGLLKYSRDYNFYPDNYKFVDTYLRVDSEGRNLVLPCIEYDKESNTIVTSGLALFENDKMTKIVGFQQSKILNLLREDNIMGMLTIEDSPKSYVNYYGKSRRKVEVSKEGNKYSFVINLRIVGDIVANEKYRDPINSPSIKKEVEQKLSESLTKQGNEFIEIMKNEHKMDCLELGRVACAKYGRDTGVDWSEIVVNSNIKVNVSVEIDKTGRGDF